MSDKQLQKAGDNSKQIQTGDIYISNGISEQRVREICSEIAGKAIADNSREAIDIAMKRIDFFTDLLLPRMQSIEKAFDSFSDPSFQVLLRKAQLTAACSDRDAKLKYKYGNRHFWSRGYYVSTVGGNKQAVQRYIQNQEKEDMITAQISMVEYYDPFKEWLESYRDGKNSKK